MPDFSVSIEIVFEHENINNIWDLFKQKLTLVANELIPYKWMRVRMDKPIWYNSYMQDIAVTRDRLFENYRRSG